MADAANIQELKNKAAAAVRDVTPMICQLIEEAYHQGYNVGFASGKQEAGQALLQFVSNMNTDRITPHGYEQLEAGDKGMAIANEAEKQPPGTVKPAVLKSIQNSPNGLSIRQIEQKTGFKSNSIRGTVWLLQKEGSVKKGEGSLWLPVDTTDDEADEEILKTQPGHEAKSDTDNPIDALGKETVSLFPGRDENKSGAGDDRSDRDNAIDTPGKPTASIFSDLDKNKSGAGDDSS